MYYLYKTTNLLNGKIYYGQHKGNFCDNYLGSGKYIKYAINKYSKENFKVELITYAESK